MWLSARLLLLPLLLTACGFQPLYGEKKASISKTNFGGVKVGFIEGRPGQLLRADLEDRLNPGGAEPSRPAYRLEASMAIIEVPVDVARDGTVSRSNIFLDSPYTLYRTSDDTPVSRGKIRHVVSYNNVVTAYFSTYVSKEDATKRGITELSEKYRQRLAAYFTSEHAGEPDPSMGKKTPPADTPLNPVPGATPFNPYQGFPGPVTPNENRY